MSRRCIIAGLLLSLVAPFAAEAQQAGKMWRLGTLSLGAPPSPETYDARCDVVVVLQDLGYVEGRNLAVERRYADGRVERLPALAVELVQRRVDVIVASGSAAVRAAQAATKAIPIVMAHHPAVSLAARGSSDRVTCAYPAGSASFYSSP